MVGLWEMTKAFQATHNLAQPLGAKKEEILEGNDEPLAVLDVGAALKFEKSSDVEDEEPLPLMAFVINSST